MKYNLIDKVNDSSFVEIPKSDEKVTLLEFTEDDCLEHIIAATSDALPYLSSALFNVSGQTAVPIVQLNDGTEMRLADWRAKNNLSIKDFQNFDKNVAFGLICDVAYLTPTNYEAIDSLLSHAKPDIKDKILGCIAEVVKTHPEQSKGYIAHLLDVSKATVTGVAMGKIEELISIGAEAEKHPQTALEKVLEKHPKAFARMFLQNRESYGLEGQPEISSDRLTLKELKGIMKVTDEIEKHAFNSKFENMMDGIKSVINSFVSMVSKNAGLSNKDFMAALEDVKSRCVQDDTKDKSALKAVMEERAKSEQNNRGI